MRPGTIIDLSKKIVFGSMAAALLSASPNAAAAQTSSSCASAVRLLGYSPDQTEFRRGGLLRRDAHVFGDVICEVDSRGNVFQITMRGQILAADGIFGLPALAARARAERISQARIDAAREERDQAVAAARAVFETARDAANEAFDATESEESSQLEALLVGLRAGVMPPDAAAHFELAPDLLDGADQSGQLEELRAEQEARAAAELEAREERRREIERGAEELLSGIRQLFSGDDTETPGERQLRDRRGEALGIPLERDADFMSSRGVPEADLIALGRTGLRLVAEQGWRCDSISSIRPFIYGRGVRFDCNEFRYGYEMEDQGGRWVVSLR